MFFPQKFLFKIAFSGGWERFDQALDRLVIVRAESGAELRAISIPSFRWIDPLLELVATCADLGDVPRGAELQKLIPGIERLICEADAFLYHCTIESCGRG